MLKQQQETTLALEALKRMEMNAVLALIDREIAKLNEAKRVLAGETEAGKPASRRRSVVSVEGRARIAAAQKARWAKVHQASAK